MPHQQALSPVSTGREQAPVTILEPEPTTVGSLQHKESIGAYVSQVPNPSQAVEKISPTESDPSEQSISDLFDVVSNISEKLEIVENLKREINFSKERDKLVRWGLTIFNAVGLAVFVAMLNSVSISASDLAVDGWP